MTDAFGGRGGIAEFNRRLLGALAAMDTIDRVRVISRGGTLGADTPRQVEQHIVRNKLAFSYRSWRAITTHGAFDLIFCGHINLCPLAVSLGRLTGRPVWLQIHGIDAWACPSKRLRYFVEKVDLVSSVSRYTRGRFLSWAKVPSHRVKILPNTVSDLPAPVRSKKERRHPTLLTVSRLADTEQYKGHDAVLTILPTLRQRHADLRYFIVGDGTDRQRLESMAERLGLSECVVFKGAVSDETLEEIYQQSDVFVMPSQGEGFGIVYLEAGRHGLPVVAGNDDGGRDPLHDGVGGWLVDPKDHDALVSAVVDALESPGRRVRCEKFSLSHFRVHASMLCNSLITQPDSAPKALRTT